MSENYPSKSEQDFQDYANKFVRAVVDRFKEVAGNRQKLVFRQKAKHLSDIIVIAEKVDVCEPPAKQQKFVIEKKWMSVLYIPPTDVRDGELWHFWVGQRSFKTKVPKGSLGILVGMQGTQMVKSAPAERNHSATKNKILKGSDYVHWWRSKLMKNEDQTFIGVWKTSACPCWIWEKSSQFYHIQH